MSELFEGLTWRDIGLGTALLVYVIINHWRDLVQAIRGVYQNHATHMHDKREFGQDMAERYYDHQAQTETAQLSHKIALDHQAFGIVGRLLDEKQEQLNDIHRTLLEILKLMALLQQSEDLSAKRFEKHFENIGASLRLAWQELQRIREEMKLPNE